MANPVSSPPTEKHHLYTQTVEQFRSMFGVHDHYRPVHAKGILCQGTFAASADAPSISRAIHFQGGEIPVTARFSNFSGVPTDGDAAPLGRPWGFALKFHLPDGKATDTVCNSYNGFPARTAEEFLEFLRAAQASPPGAPSPTAIDAFLTAHPRSKPFITDPKPTPISFVTDFYYSVTSFRFTNRDGVSRVGRYRYIPLAGAAYLSDAEEDRAPVDYLMDELRQRLAKGPAQLRLVVQLAAEGDPTHDPTIVWPEDRPQVELGTLTLRSTVADSVLAERSLLFDPGRLTDGIDYSDDPIPRDRSGAYAVSFAWRNPS